MAEPLKEGQSVKHVKRKLHEARFSGYLPEGKVRVTYNNAYPWGVCWASGVFKAENIVSASQTK